MSWESLFSAGLEPDDAAAWGRLVQGLRDAEDALAAASFSREVVEELTADVARWKARLAPLEADELGQVNGRVPGLPVRGHAMVPPLVVRSLGDGRVDGSVRFGRWFMGGGMAAHGGAVALLFDEVLGILAARSSGGITRTASLTTDFRALTPIDADLDVVAWVDRVEGRKIFVRGEVRHGDVVCVESRALFLTLLPEQGLGKRTTD